MPVNWPTAREMMTPRPITLPVEEPLSSALGIMRSKNIHEIPVMRNRKLIGMITFETIARRTNLPLSTKIEHLVTLPPMVTEATTYPELAGQLLAAGMRAAPVLGKRGELVGVVSRTDMVRVLGGLAPISGQKVEEVMSPPTSSVRDNERCGTLFSQIRQLEEHPLPVVDRSGKLVGAVGIADLGRLLWKPTRGGKRDAEKRGSILDVEISSIMTSPALVLPIGATTGEAAELMTKKKVSSVIIVDEAGKPVGVVSQGDLLGLAVGASAPEGAKLGDVYVQIHGLRGSSDPEILTEIDRVLAKGLRHISRHVKPVLLSLHISPHAAHRTGDATVSARLYAEQGIFYASLSSWNFYAGVAGLMDELAEQTRRVHEGDRQKRRRSPKGVPSEEMPVDADLEAKIRAATDRDEN